MPDHREMSRSCAHRWPRFEALVGEAHPTNYQPRLAPSVARDFLAADWPLAYIDPLKCSP